MRLIELNYESSDSTNYMNNWMQKKALLNIPSASLIIVRNLLGTMKGKQ